MPGLLEYVHQATRISAMPNGLITITLLGLLGVAACAATTQPLPPASPKRAYACPGLRATDWANATIARQAGHRPVGVSDEDAADAATGGYADRYAAQRSALLGPMRFVDGTFTWDEERTELLYLNPDDDYGGPAEQDAARAPAVRYGDLTGDGCDEAVLHLTDSGGGTNRSKTLLMIVGVAWSGELRAITKVGGSNGYCGRIASFAIEDGVLVLTRWVHPGDPSDAEISKHLLLDCADHDLREERWRYDAGTWSDDPTARRLIVLPRSG